jgi:hypothetical protein
MRANEFIIEANGKVPKRAKQAMNKTHMTRDVGGYDRTNHLNRLAMAMACADGKSTSKIDMDSYSWVEKYNSIHPYTKEEENMVKAAMKTVPTDHKHAVRNGSKEMDDTHKTSPVLAFKGYGK